MWKRDHLENAEASLTASINQSQNPSHHLLASRALVRTRLQRWDAALLDAEMVFFTRFTHTLTLTLLYTKALKIEPSLIAYIAKSLAHVGNGERDKGYRACDIAFEHFHSSHVTFLLLVKVCVFVLGSLFCSHLLGHCCVYGGRTPRCDRTFGRPYRHCQAQLNLLCGPGACITRHYVLNSTADVFDRHTCIFSSETRTWRAATTRMR